MLEVGARIFGPGIMPPDTSRDLAHGEAAVGQESLLGDEIAGWRTRPGTHRDFGVPVPTTVNERGLRGADVPLEKPAGMRRILLLGDSTVYGVRVSDTESFSGRLQQRLQAQLGAVQVLNAGCPGYSSWQALQILRARLLDYQADWVVIATLWSDAQGTTNPDAAKFGNGKGRSLLSHSAFYVWLQAKLRRHKWQKATPENIEFRFEPGPGGPPPGDHQMHRGPNKLAPTHRVPLADYKRNLRKMAKEVRANGGQVAFLVLPCYRDLLLDGKVGDFRDAYRKAMRDVAKELDAPLIDSTTAFRTGDPRALFFDEVHPTSLGHERIAQSLYRVLLPQMNTSP